MGSTSIDGQVYAIRNKKELGLGLGFACNAQMLKSLGVDYGNVRTEADMGPILKAVKEKYPDTFRCVEKITAFIEKKYKYRLLKDEQLYLTIHIERVIHKTGK